MVPSQGRILPDFSSKNRIILFLQNTTDFQGKIETVFSSLASILLCKRRSAVSTGIIIPGHQLFQLGIGHIFVGPCIEQEHQVVFNVLAVSFCHFHHRICSGAGVSPSGGVAEQPVLAANGEGADAVFAGIIGQTASAILKVGIQIRSAVERILDCFTQSAALVVPCQFFQPTPEGGQDR